MFCRQRLAPKIPIGRKEAHAHRYDVLFEFEGADSPKVTELLHGNSDVSAVLDVNPRAHERLQHIDDGDQGRIGCCRHRTTLAETARHLPRRHQNGHRLKCDRCQETNRQEEVNEQQDAPECVFSHYAGYEVHGVLLRFFRFWQRHPACAQLLLYDLNSMTTSTALAQSRIEGLVATALLGPR